MNRPLRLVGALYTRIVLLAFVAVSGCKSVGGPATVRCRENKELERAAYEELEALENDLLSRLGEPKQLRMTTRIKAVPADGMSYDGIPYFNLGGDIVHGVAHLRRKRANILFPVTETGFFHRPALRHELLHVVLHGYVEGHPLRYKDLVFRWRDPRFDRVVVSDY